MSEEREQRNQVFGGEQQRSHAVINAEKVKADFGLDIPNETVPLPSCGKTYHPQHPLHKAERVDIRAMTAREEDILTSPALLKKGTVITELIRSCLVDKQIDPVELLTGDRNALMVAIRITGYGAEYETEVECGGCNVKSKQVFNLAELPIKSLELEPVEPGSNLFEFVLPYCKKSVKFKFMNGLDEEEIVVSSERQKKLGMQASTSVTTSLMHSIVSIDNVTDKSKINAFIKLMPARDSLALRNYIKENEPGLRLKQEKSCPMCDHTEEVSMPLGASFLWPSTAG